MEFNNPRYGHTLCGLWSMWKNLSYLQQKSSPLSLLQLLEEAGFCNVRAEDRTVQFIDVIETELKRAEAIKEEFIGVSMCGLAQFIFGSHAPIVVKPHHQKKIQSGCCCHRLKLMSLLPIGWNSGCGLTIGWHIHIFVCFYFVFVTRRNSPKRTTWQ